MATISIKAGATLSYGGTVSNLDPSTTWEGSIAFKNTATGALMTPTATLTLTQSADYSTSKNYDLLISATPETTAAWFATFVPKASIKSLLLSFDIKFVDANNAENVIYSDTVQLSVEKSVTP